MSQTYTDPSRLFRINLPDGFERDPSAKSLVFRHPDVDGRVTVSALRHRLDAPDVEIFDALPSREGMQNVRSETREGIRIRYGDYEGTLRNAPEFWRWWTMQRGPVGIVVSFNGEPDGDSSLVDALVAGITIPSRLPVPPEDYTQLGAEVYAELMKVSKPEISKPLELVTGPGSALRLDNAYMSYLNNYDVDDNIDARKLLVDWLEHLWGEQKEGLGPFEEIRGLIYPVVRAAGFARETNVSILRRDLLAGELELFAAVDTGRTLRFLSQEDVAGWEGVSEDDVFFYARENLLALSAEVEMQALANAEGKPCAVIIATNDGHDAARVCLPTFYEKLSAVLGPELLVGLPNRDFLIILSADDPTLVANIASQVKIDAQTRPYAISGKLYRLTADGLAP
ncbi:MAG: DUF1444 family protein [Planctomycetes bacterium]|nr:DUF1444 family protein [Planctomycetota bacterium]MCW8137032.1 DUF1444 family protein [Planctomycetota bacterium]